MYPDQSRPPVTAWHTTALRPVAIMLGIVVLAVIGYHLFRHYLSIPLTIILLAIMLTYLLRPIVERMVRFSAARYVHAARIVAVLLLYAAIGWALFAVVAVTAQTVRADSQALRQTWQRASVEVPQQFDRLYQLYLTTVPTGMRRQISDSLRREMNTFVPSIVPKLMGVAQVAFEWAGLLIELIFVPLVAFYLLTDASRVREQVMGFVPTRFRERVTFYAAGMDTILRHYVIGQLILCAIAWVLVTVALLLLHIPGAFLLGLIAGVSRAIPVIGPVVGGVPVLAAVLIANGDAFWWVLIGFTLMHLLESKVVMPRVLGDHLGMHPVIIILSLLVGYELMGLLGMFIAPPAVAMVRFVLRERRGENGTLPSTPEAAPEAVPVAVADPAPG